MAFDGFVTGAMALYLNTCLSNGKIDKIYQPGKDELVFHVYKDRIHQKLYLSANSSHPRIHLLPLDFKSSNPREAPTFSMLLRKHFRGGIIEKIEQYKSERIIEIFVSQRDDLGFSKKKKLIIEIMGKHSNISAIDLESGKILDSIKRIPPEINRYRSLLPGVSYVYPPDHGKTPFYNLPDMDLSSSASDILSSVQGISPTMAHEIYNRSLKSGLKPVAIISQLVEDMVSGNHQAFVYEDKTKFPVDFHIFELTEKASLYQRRDFETLNSCLLYYYSHKDLGNRMKQKSNDLEKRINNTLRKLYLKKEKLLGDLKNAKKAETHRLYGELLTSSLHSVERGAKSARIFNYYENKEIDIPLDPRFSPANNAKNYFKKYNKAKTAQKEKRKQIRETDEAISYLEGVMVFIENAQKPEDIDTIREELNSEGFIGRRSKKRTSSKNKMQPLLFTPEDSVSIRVGKNNKENEYLTFRRAKKNDIWFHAKDIPGSHVILSIDGEARNKNLLNELDPLLLEKAAALAAYYSKSKNSTNVPVDYTTVSNVKKIPAARPGAVTYRNHKTIIVDPSETI